MAVLHYYAKLNENDICYGFETLAKRLKTEELPSNLIPLDNYNESYLWKKYDRQLKAFSSKTYEPSIEAELQERIEQLETEKVQLQEQIMQLQRQIFENLPNVDLEIKLALAELAELIVGGVD